MKFHNKTVYRKPYITYYIDYKLFIFTPLSTTEAAFTVKKPVPVLGCSTQTKHTPTRTHSPTHTMDEAALKQLQLRVEEAYSRATAAEKRAIAADAKAEKAEEKAISADTKAEKALNLATNISDRLEKLDKLEQDQLTSRTILESLSLNVNNQFKQLIGHFDQQSKRETARQNADRKVSLEAVCFNESVSFRVMPVNPSFTICGLPLLDVMSQANTLVNLHKIVENLESFQHYTPGQQAQVRNGSAISNINIDKTTKNTSINARGFVVQCPNAEIASTLKASLRKEVKGVHITQIKSPYKHISVMKKQIHNQLSPLLKSKNNRPPPVLYFKVKSDIITIESNIVLAIKVCITTTTREVITLAYNVPPTGTNHQVLAGKRGGCLQFKLQGDSEESGCLLITESIKNAFLQAIENSEFFQKYPNIFEECSPIEQHSIEEHLIEQQPPTTTSAAPEPNTAVHREDTQAATSEPTALATYAAVTAFPSPLVHTTASPNNATATPTHYPPNRSYPPPSTCGSPDVATTTISGDYPAIRGPFPTSASRQARDHRGNQGSEVTPRSGHNYPTRRGGRGSGIRPFLQALRGPT